MKRHIIIGASGLIGNELYSLLLNNKCNVIGTYNSNQTDGLIQFNMKTQSINEVIPDINKSDIIYLMSAYINPTWIHNNINESRKLNLDASKKLIDDIKKNNPKMMFLSTVDVFDGVKGNYEESDMPNPTTDYGKMKYEIERYISANITDYSILRTSWNIGSDLSHRCVIQMTYDALQANNAKIAYDNYLSLVDVNDTAHCMVQLADRNVHYCNIASSPFVNRADMAHLIKKISKYGKNMSFEEVPFDAIKYNEARGKNNYLNNSFILQELKYRFKTPCQIIIDKVKLLDDNHDHN